MESSLPSQSIALPSFTSFDPLKIDPLDVSDLVDLWQESQPTIDSQSVNLEPSDCNEFAPPMPQTYAGSTRMSTAKVVEADTCQLRKSYELGCITRQGLVYLKRLKSFWNRILGHEVMRRAWGILMQFVQRLGRITALQHPLECCSFMQPDWDSLFLLNVVQRQSACYLQGQQMIHEIAESAYHLSWQEALNQAVEKVQTLLQADRVCVYQSHDKSGVFVCAESVQEPYSKMLHQQFYDGYISSQAAIENFQAGHYLSIVDVCRPSFSISHPGPMSVMGMELPTSPEHVSGLEAFQIKSKLALPIREQGGKLWGLLVIHHCSGVREWQAPEVALLQLTAFHLGAALERASWTRQLQQLQHDLETQKYQHQLHLQEVEKIHRLKDDFLSTVSHELKTPLSTMKMVTDLLKLSLQSTLKAETQSSGAMGSPLNQYLTMLEEECDREINLVNDLLMSQNLESGTYPLSLTSLDLADWLAHITDSFHYRANFNQQQFHLDLAQPLPRLKSDVFILNRILVELFNNACKYTPAGGLISVQAYPIQAPDQRQTIRLVISNTGVEISSEHLRRVFDTFYRISGQVTCSHNGTGLGLALVKRLVEYIGGTIWVESACQQVHFFVELPLNPDLVLQAV